MYDTKLLMAAQEGDDAAFAALFDRNVDAVYDLCWALTGDESEASRLVIDVFTLAARHLGDITDASQIRPWLLAIARHRVLADDNDGILHSAWGAGPPSDPVSDEPLGTAELRRWTRSAGATLALPDQLVLELARRNDFDGDQLAAVIGCDPLEVEHVVDQVEVEATSVLGALVVARQGRRDCPELDGLLEGWDGRPAVDVADAVDRHARDCERCSRRRALAGPLESFAAAPGVIPPPQLRNEVLEGITAHPPSPPLAAIGPSGPAILGATGGRPATTVAAPMPPPPDQVVAILPGVEPHDPYPWALFGAVGAALVVLAVALVLVFTAGHHDRVSASPKAGPVAAVTPKVTLAPVTTPGTIVPPDTTTTTTLIAAPGSRLGLDANQVDLGTTATSVRVVLTNAGTSGTGWRASSGATWLTCTPTSGALGPGGAVTVSLLLDRQNAPTGRFQVRVTFIPSQANGTAVSLLVDGTNSATTTTTPTSTTSTTQGSVGPSITNVSASPSTIQASPCPADHADVSATVNDPAGVSSVAISYTPPGGPIQTAAMSQAGNRWSGTITASSSPGTLTYQITATDSSGVTTTSPSHSIMVGACPV